MQDNFNLDSLVEAITEWPDCSKPRKKHRALYNVKKIRGVYLRKMNKYVNATQSAEESSIADNEYSEDANKLQSVDDPTPVIYPGDTNEDLSAVSNQNIKHGLFNNALGCGGDTENEEVSVKDHLSASHFPSMSSSSETKSKIPAHVFQQQTKPAPTTMKSSDRLLSSEYRTQLNDILAMYELGTHLKGPDINCNTSLKSIDKSKFKLANKLPLATHGKWDPLKAGLEVVNHSKKSQLNGTLDFDEWKKSFKTYSNSASLNLTNSNLCGKKLLNTGNCSETRPLDLDFPCTTMPGSLKNKNLNLEKSLKILDSNFKPTETESNHETNKTKSLSEFIKYYDDNFQANLKDKPILGLKQNINPAMNDSKVSLLHKSYAYLDHKTTLNGSSKREENKNVHDVQRGSAKILEAQSLLQKCSNNLEVNIAEYSATQVSETFKNHREAHRNPNCKYINKKHNGQSKQRDNTKVLNAQAKKDSVDLEVNSVQHSALHTSKTSENHQEQHKSSKGEDENRNSQVPEGKNIRILDSQSLLKKDGINLAVNISNLSLNKCVTSRSPQSDPSSSHSAKENQNRNEVSKHTMSLDIKPSQLTLNLNLVSEPVNDSKEQVTTLSNKPLDQEENIYYEDIPETDMKMMSLELINPSSDNKQEDKYPEKTVNNGSSDFRTNGYEAKDNDAADDNFSDLKIKRCSKFYYISSFFLTCIYRCLGLL